MPTTTTFDTLRETGLKLTSDLQQQAKTLYDVLRTRGKAVADQTRATLNRERDLAEGRVRDALDQAQSALQTAVGPRFGQLVQQEFALIEQAEAVLGDARNRTNGNATAQNVVEALQRALDAYRQVDERGHRLADKVLGASQLPIDGYDELNAQTAVKAAQKLGRNELLTVRAYEARNKARKTVLRELDQLLAH